MEVGLVLLRRIRVVQLAEGLVPCEEGLVTPVGGGKMSSSGRQFLSPFRGWLATAPRSRCVNDMRFEDPINGAGPQGVRLVLR